MTRIFYGLYVANDRLAAALDLLRFLAEPRFLRRAHITVSGPYTKPQSESLKRSRGHSYKIIFSGVDSFMEGNAKQNTVFIKCNVPSIEQVWHKPDYVGDIKPHITLYDGADRTQAFTLLRRCQKYDWSFETQSTALLEIKPKSHAAEVEEFEAYQDLYSEVLGKRIDYRTIQQQHWRDRLSYFDYVADFIQHEFASPLVRD